MDVWTSLTFKGNHCFQIKVITISTVSLQIVEFDSSNSNSLGDLILVFKVRIFRFDLSFSTSDGFLESWLEQDDVSFTSREFLAILGYKTKVNVNHIVTPSKSHFLQDSFQLFKVVRLLLTDSIDIFNKVVSTSTVDGCCDITSDVESSAI